GRKQQAGVYRSSHLVRLHSSDQRGCDRSLQPGESGGTGRRPAAERGRLALEPACGFLGRPESLKHRARIHTSANELSDARLPVLGGRATAAATATSTARMRPGRKAWTVSKQERPCDPGRTNDPFQVIYLFCICVVGARTAFVLPDVRLIHSPT